MTHSRDEAERAFRAKVKTLRCPGCQLEFTDRALEWYDAWFEGRCDLLREIGWKMRDGPTKLKCESCGHRSWLNEFDDTIRSAEDGSKG